jgi:hypothetical protein
MRQSLIALVATTGLLLGLGAGLAAPAGAATSWADARADARPTSLPVNEVVDLSGATVEADEPKPSCNQQIASVWATFTLTQPATLQLDSTDMNVVYFLSLAVFPHGSADSVMCAGMNYGNSVATLPAGTYDLMVGLTNISNGTSINASLEVLTPAPNDSIAGAAPLAVPSTGVRYDTRAATLQPGETTPCNAGANATVWYSFVAPPSGHVAMLTEAMVTGFALFRGSSINDLVYSGHCFQGGGSFGVTPGDTYLLQVATEPARATFETFDVSEPPPLELQLTVNPSAPGAGETVYVYSDVNNSANSPVASCSFDFGDGSPLVESTHCVMAGFPHVYATDGVYTITGRATTEDGRTDDATTTVTVATHDVGIAAVKVPCKIKVGKEKSITVKLVPVATPQSVVVTLFLSSEQDFQTIATQSLTIPAGKRAATVRFPWTPTAAQAAQGLVSLVATVNFTDPNLHDTNSSNDGLITKPFRIVGS